jgi:phage terminase Nu1 subunit (DNA packaging protein)
MLEEIEWIRDRLAMSSDGRSRDLVDVLDLLRREVSARLAFEDALGEYLRNVAANPFSASAALAEFLELDLRSEDR